jgi:hypothetical protein
MNRDKFDREYLIGMLARTRPAWPIGDCIHTVDTISCHLPAIQRAKEAPCCIMRQDELDRYERIGREKFKALAKYLNDRRISVHMGSGDPRGPTIEMNIISDDGSALSYYMSGEGFTAEQIDRMEKQTYANR